MNDNLGDRMKEYENSYSIKLPKRLDYIIRLDGRHFHSLTKGMEKPFDMKFINIMRKVAMDLLKEIQNAKVVYVQSDEISIYLNPGDKLESQPWFDNKLQKIVSISASFATMKFNQYLREAYDKQGMFDSRVFIIPKEDIPNYFIWRQRDWERNSLQMYCQSIFSQKELNKKNKSDMHQMLFEKGVNWCDLENYLKNGSFFIKEESKILEMNEKINYDFFQKFINKELL